MSKPDYPFDFDKTRKVPDTARRVRLAALGVAVAAVTCGGIWFFLPRKSAEPVAPPPVESQEPQNVVDPLDKVEDVVAPEKGPAKGANTAVKPVPVDDPEVGEAEKRPTASDAKSVPVDDVVVEDPVTALPGTDPNAVFTAEPVKGKVHPSDPVDDKPRYAPDAVEPGGFASSLKALEALQRGGKYAEARDRANEMLAELTPDSRQWRAAAGILSRANAALLFSGGRDGKQVYEVRKGDNLYVIAKKNGISVTALRKMNKIPDGKDTLWVGQKLIVGTADWNIKIGKKSRLLKLYDGKNLFSVYDIGIGRLGRTPLGAFTIGDKIKSPPYHAPDGRIVAPGAPENELGSRFLKLFPVGGGDKMPQGYGIHGTADESTVTRSVSNGCIRMRNAEVEELFTIVPNGTKVEIEE